MGRPVKPIGSLGCDMPIALLAATGCYAGPLAFDADRPTPWADRWLESKFAPWAFQILEDWAGGTLDHLDSVIFSRGDDSCQRLYYYVCELRRAGQLSGPEPVIFDVAHIKRASSAAETISAVRRLGERLQVSEAALGTALEAQTPLPAARTSSGPSCLLAGTLPPDRRLHRAIEALGWAPDGETLPESWLARAAPASDEAGDAFERLGRRLHAATEGPRGFCDRVAALSARVAATGAGAVILWFCEHDEAEVWHAPALRKQLEAERIPHLVLTRRDWRGADGAVEEIAGFLKGLSR
jgi:hypothetical protein